MRKAVFFDIDGTLLDCFGGITKITARVEKAIRDLQAQGVYVFIATGRPYAFLSRAILDFGFDGFILTNGAYVVMHDKAIYKDCMDKQFVCDCIETLEKDNIQYILEGGKYSYMKEEFTDFYQFYDDIGISRRLLKGEYDIEETDVYKIEMLCPDEKAVRLCLEIAESNPSYDYFNSIDTKSFELYAKKNTKAVGIKHVLDYLHIDINNSYAFGDGKNDIEMLSAVGCGIAMGNAHEEVKKYADKVTDTVKNDGVALGIDKYILNK